VYGGGGGMCEDEKPNRILLSLALIGRFIILVDFVVFFFAQTLPSSLIFKYNSPPPSKIRLGNLEPKLNNSNFCSKVRMFEYIVECRKLNSSKVRKYISNSLRELN
jgi:hypothetical protein